MNNKATLASNQQLLPLLRPLLLSLLLPLFLSACGGGGGGSNDSTSEKLDQWDQMKWDKGNWQ